jgi:ABC-2 type transport system ATP-binding protein
MNREVALRVCRADIRRFLSNPANLKLLLLLPVAIIGSLWPYIGSPFVPLLLMTFAGLEPQFNNILFRTNNEFEAMAVLSPDWRSVVLGKNLASIVMAIGTTLAAALVVGYFTPLTMGAEGWQDAGLFFVSVVFSLLSPPVSSLPATRASSALHCGLQSAHGRILVAAVHPAHRRHHRQRKDPTMSDGMTVLEINDLTKTYETGHRALDGLTLRVSEGSIFGFLGLNGAGKTTTIRIIAGLCAHDGGTLRIFGQEIRPGSTGHLGMMGFVLDEPLYFDWMEPGEYLDFVGAMYGLDPRERGGRVDELLEFFDLTQKAGDPIFTFSTGMKKKISLAAAIIHRPRLIILDEPLEGIDALAASAIKETLALMAGKGTTVFITSHVLDTVEKLCSDIAILHKGKQVLQARTDSIRSLTRGKLSDSTYASLEELFVEAVSDNVRRRHISFI